jgi:uncharacterized protein (TIRG00374 family)
VQSGDPPTPAAGARPSSIGWLRTVALGLVVGGLFLGLALWGVPLAALRDAFAQMHGVYLFHVAAAVVVQYLLRAARQQVMLHPLAPGLGFRDHLSINVVGFFCVNVFPARLGEAVRPLLFSDRAGVPLGAGFAMVLVERVFDLIALLVGLLVALAWMELPDRTIEIAGRSVAVADLARSAASVVLAPVLGGLLALALLGPAALRLGERIATALAARLEAPLLHRLLRGLLGFGAAFVEGLRGLRSPVRLAAVIVLTALLFGVMGGMMSALAHAFGLEGRIGFAPGFAVLAITMLGIALPAPPGFAGVFEASARAGLALFGVRGEELAGTSLAFALVFHWWPFLLLCALAGFFLWRDRIGIGRLFRFARGPSA